MSWRSAAPVIALLAVLAALAARGVALPGSRADPERPGGRLAARVVRVVDGDTVEVAIGDRVDTVRYIGMDTPETVKPDTPVQCYGERASRENKRLVAGRAVTLRFDAELRDRYGRLLAYVFRRPDGLFVNAALVRHGFARTLTFPPNTAHVGLLAHLARRAQAADRGLWRACAGA